MKKTIFFLAVLLAAAGLWALCLKVTVREGDFTAAEREIITRNDSVMYVTLISEPLDSAFLRTPSRELSPRAIRSGEFRTLAAKMLATVQSPQQGGVGIAAPQVGIGRRVIAVQRFDKDGEPFEVYPNVRIDSLFGEVVPGPEGCLSVPGKRGTVRRNRSVIIRFTNPETLETVVDTVHGFTAVIFQHECDHLDGIMYTDRAASVWTNPVRDAERAAYDALGLYRRPAWLKLE